MGDPLTDNELLREKVNHIGVDVNDMKNSMSRVADALTKFAILEERHTNFTTTFAKAHSDLLEQTSNLAKRVTDLEKEQIRSETRVQSAMTAVKVIWIVFGGAFTFVIGKMIGVSIGAPL